MIPLFSSLPPGMNRFDNTGQNIGEYYLQTCLQSWSDHGLKVYSINAEKEAEPEIARRFGIDRITLSRDAKLICGKPLVYFSDFLKAAYDHSDGPVVITNSDIELNIGRDDLDQIRSLSVDEFICEPRFDYRFGEKKSGVSYQGGFDFFAFHRDIIPDLLDNELVFGMPWWDHYVPVTLLAMRLKRLRLGAASQVFHLDHNERWDMERFFYFGKIFRSELDKIAARNEMSRGYRTMYDRLVKIEKRNPYFPYPRRENFLKNLLDREPEDPLHNHMLWIAFGALRLLEQPDEQPLPRISWSRFIQRLPF